MSKEIKRMDIKEFREFGLLQEINRLFLHPLGLALEIVQEDDGTERLGGIWDYRDDKEGMLFGDDMVDEEKRMRVMQFMFDQHRKREKSIGYVVQGGDTK